MALAVALGLCAAACGKVQAKTPGPSPTLSMPDPPTRLVLPVSVDPPVPPATTVNPPPATTTRPTTTRPTPTPAATPSPTPLPGTDTPPVLQTSASLSQSEKDARERLDRAKKDIGRVARGALGNDAKDQYDSAQRYIKMAQDAITMKNFVYALFCADKAATLAGLLVK